MPNALMIVWIIGGVAMIGLIVAAYRSASAWLRAGLAITASAALVYALTTNPLALALFAVNILLVLGTWFLGRGKYSLTWVFAMVVMLAISKLPLAASDGPGATQIAASAGLWLGFSYLSFRLIHVTLEARAGRLKDPTLPELLTFSLHPASLVAGPIDRLPASSSAQRQPGEIRENIHQGLWRVLVGLLKKFVIANPIFAVIALYDMPSNPDQPVGVAWLWLIGYSLYLFMDFAAYSDIAIGVGRLAGLRLPENFDRPYLSPSIAIFWQRWHISLSTWLRDYIFFPMARALRARTRDRFKGLIQFACHLTTMALCGLWHGLSTGYLAWGLWHGVGLFVHGQIASRQSRARQSHPLVDRARSVFEVGMTYLFVTLGWVFFAADLPTALRIMGRLFGVI